MTSHTIVSRAGGDARRRGLGRFHDRDVARREARRDLLRRDQERVVERRHEAAHAQRDAVDLSFYCDVERILFFPTPPSRVTTQRWSASSPKPGATPPRASARLA